MNVHPNKDAREVHEDFELQRFSALAPIGPQIGDWFYHSENLLVHTR